MTDPLSHQVRGWQNVLRIIDQWLRNTTAKPGEKPLHPMEEGEHEAWTVAHEAVMNQIVERNERPDDGA